MLATYMEYMRNNNLKIRIGGSSCRLQLCRTLQHLMFVKQSGLLDYSLWHRCYKDLQNMYSVLSYHHYHIMFNIYMYLYFSGWRLTESCFFFFKYQQLREGTNIRRDGSLGWGGKVCRTVKSSNYT